MFHNSLFIYFFYFSFSSFLANGKHGTENHATYFRIFVTSSAKTKNEKWKEKNIKYGKIQLVVIFDCLV